MGFEKVIERVRQNVADDARPVVEDVFGMAYVMMICRSRYENDLPLKAIIKLFTKPEAIQKISLMAYSDELHGRVFARWMRFVQQFAQYEEQMSGTPNEVLSKACGHVLASPQVDNIIRLWVLTLHNADGGIALMNTVLSQIAREYTNRGCVVVSPL